MPFQTAAPSRHAEAAAAAAEAEIKLSTLQNNLKSVGTRYRELIATLREADVSSLDKAIVSELKEASLCARACVGVFVCDALPQTSVAYSSDYFLKAAYVRI